MRKALVQVKHRAGKWEGEKREGKKMHFFVFCYRHKVQVPLCIASSKAGARINIERNNMEIRMNNYKLHDEEMEIVARGFARQWLKDIKSWLEMGSREGEYISIDDYASKFGGLFYDRVATIAFSRLSRIKNEERLIVYNDKKLISMIKSYAVTLLKMEEFSDVKTYLIGRRERKEIETNKEQAKTLLQKADEIQRNAGRNRATNSRNMKVQRMMLGRADALRVKAYQLSADIDIGKSA